MIPEFAILGHPNEGKSSVLSTLTEDDSVRISAEPGETIKCRTFPVIIDNREIIRFTDTPGFQNPTRMLSEMQKFSESSEDPLQRFYRRYHNDDDLRHDCELLRPLLRGAGILYVADGSRPLRQVDLAEMEILRLTGKPRMAILNCKRGEEEYSPQWKAQFRKHFNSSRVFNAHRADYRQRIRLLEALKSIEQDWQEVLDYVVTTFKDDWRNRNYRTSELISELLTDCLQLKMEKNVAPETSLEPAKKELFHRYTAKLAHLENLCHREMRKIFKHNVFDYRLPSHSILHQDLFADETWQFLGLSRSQLAITGGAGGAALAAGLDLAAGGASLGLFTSIGGALGAFGAVYGSRNIASKIKVLGIGTATIKLQIGPNTNPQFPFIVLDRALLYYSHITTWAHGRRDYDASLSEKSPPVLTRSLPRTSLKTIGHYFRMLQKNGSDVADAEDTFKKLIMRQLNVVSGAEEYEDNDFH